MSTDIADRHPLIPAPSMAAREQACQTVRGRVRGAVMVVAALAMAALATGAQAGPNLTNGNFSLNSSGNPWGSGTSGACSGSVNQQLTYSQGGAPGDAVGMDGWTNTSTYSFVLNQNNSTSFEGGGGCIGVYGNTATSAIAPPAGSTYYIGADGAYGGYNINNSASSAGNYAYLYTTVTGLVPGATYAVMFDMAATQQYTWGGATSDQWLLGFSPTTNLPNQNNTNATSTGASETIDLNNTTGNCSTSTPSNTNCTWASPGWVGQTVDLVASAASEILWFMANDTDVLGNNEPPFSLLAGVSMSELTTVPEPPAYAVLLVGLLALAGARYRRRAKAA